MGVRICIFCIEDKQASESATKGGIQKLRFSNQYEVRGHFFNYVDKILAFFDHLPTPS